jgi:small subunit ribosomal protein S2
MTKVSIAALLDAGAHFGHQTRRWNPKMKPYIFGSRGDIYIIDLKETLYGLDAAYTFISNLARKGGSVLFVGTKKQAQEAVADAANRCGMPYVNARWLGGMLTNFVTIRSRVTYMENLEAMEADGRMALLPKKEQIALRKELAKLQANLNGIRNMKRTPDAIFVIDTNREEIAIREARRLRIRVKGEDGKMYLPHTLNNTVVAPPRMLIAFLENHLQADGSVTIPEVLWPYMGGIRILTPKK